MSSISTERASAPATAALAREPGSPADLADVHAALRQAEIACLRAARNLADAQAVATALVHAAQELAPQNARGPANSPVDRAPDIRVLKQNNSDDDYKRPARG